MTTTIPSTVTIETLELLATEIEADESAIRSRLARLCTAYVRMLAPREPDTSSDARYALVTNAASMGPHRDKETVT